MHGCKAACSYLLCSWPSASCTRQAMEQQFAPQLLAARSTLLPARSGSVQVQASSMCSVQPSDGSRVHHATAIKGRLSFPNNREGVLVHAPTKSHIWLSPCFSATSCSARSFCGHFGLQQSRGLLEAGGKAGARAGGQGGRQEVRLGAVFNAMAPSATGALVRRWPQAGPRPWHPFSTT